MEGFDDEKRQDYLDEIINIFFIWRSEKEIL